MPPFFTKYKRIIIGTIIGAFITIILVLSLTKGYTNYKEYTRLINEKQIIIDSLAKQNNDLTIRFDSAQKVINNQQGKILNNEVTIDQNNKEIQKLRRQYYEKIKSVDNLTPNGVDSFFRNRYHDYYPTH